MRNRVWEMALAMLLFTSTCLSADGIVGIKVVKITARRFQFNPREVILKKDMPVVLQLVSEDRVHGFNIPAMNVRADIVPDKVVEVMVTPHKAGDFEFFCDVFCGSGHEDMSGKIVVTDN